jgi:GNAT superfamily N-acetyltransferase
MDGLRLVAVGYGHSDATRLIETVQQEYVARYGGPDESPVDPLTFDPPYGTFLVGYLGEVPVTMGAWRRRTDLEAFGTAVVAEIKRMYVVPETRGAGHARAVLAELERTAAEAGVEALVLETGLRQPEAIGLYTSSGYTPIPSFGHYRESPLNRCFGKRLRPPS